MLQKPKRHGMQPFTNMHDIPIMFLRARKLPLYIPIGIDRGYNIESPENNMPTPRYMWQAFFTHPRETKLVSVRIGLPITHEELMEEARQPGNDANYILGRKVAALLPQKARGVYA